MSEPLTSDTELTQVSTRLDRRRFLRKAGIVGAALPVAAGAIASACY